MSHSIYSSYPPALSPEQESYLVQTVKDWTIQHGLAVRPSPSFISEEAARSAVLATNAPVTLFPSPFPRSCFEHAKSLQKTYNELYAAIASDEKWLEAVLQELFEVDDFLANLWKVHLTVKTEGYVQSLSLGLFRSDYMLDTPSSTEPQSLKQVEFNTISSSFGGLAGLVASLHTELASFPSRQTQLAYPPHELFNSGLSAQQGFESEGVPPSNKAVETLCSGLAAAHNAYGSSKSSPALPLCILFLVQDRERNIFDQLALSSYLWSSHKISSFRLPVSSILKATHVPAENASRPLIYTPPSNPDQKFEATVVYFRALYGPAEYTSPEAWTARTHLERSSAIKCPTVLLQLSGSKKVQQVLTSTPPGPDHLAHFLPTASPSTLASLRSTFAPQYSLSITEDSNSEGLALALNPTTAARHVLKPQREGGGNNIYRTNIPPFLASIPEKDYKQYILMELIHPPAEAKNTVLRSDGAVVSGDVISELGIFGTCLWRRELGNGHDSAAAADNNSGSSKPEILQNAEGGYLLRTKGKDSDEGGVAAGFSSLDSVILYNDDGVAKQ